MPTDFAGLLNNVFRIERPQLVPDGAGGSTRQLVAVADVPGRLRPLSPRERLSAQRSEAVFDHVLYLAAGADVRRGDLVSDVARDGAKLRVVEVAEPSYAGHHLEVRCTRELDPSAGSGGA